ncbi:MAG: hypothetical protein ACOCRX_11915 [Candidatus Woesearchaeota archaeon]
MPFHLMSVTIDRNTGEKLSEEIIEYNVDLNEDEIYNTLVEIFYRHMYRKE